MKYVILFLLTFLSTQTHQLYGQPNDEHRTSSPYFHIHQEGVSADHFSLLGTKVQANIIGPMVDVTVAQTYKNDGPVPIEAIYVFPASTRAAVYAMEMRIGERLIIAEIQEKGEARRNYEQAKGEGKRASLLEQKRSNVFQMNVANILPGDVIQVRMQYHEILLPEDRVYSFIYPTVVGPRFLSDVSKGNDEEFAINPFLSEGEVVPYTFDVEVNVRIPTHLSGVRSRSHRIETRYVDKTSASVTLSQDERRSGNRDFILSYQMAGEKMSSGTMLFDEGTEKYFLTMVEPPKRIREEQILPREYIFVVDISGSMHGFPLNASKRLMADLIGKLQKGDFFNVMLFAGSAQMLSSRSLVATPENLSLAIEMLNEQMGAGGTELLPALKKALAFPKACHELSRSIVVVTDGYITVEEEVFHVIEENLDQANLFAFGIGSSVNRLLIEGMAHVGRGEPIIITDEKYATEQAERFRKYVQRPLLTNIEIQFEDFQAYDVLPRNIPDLMAERPIYIFGKYRGEIMGSIAVSGSTFDGQYFKSNDVSGLHTDDRHAAIRYLWAREKIRLLQDYNQLAQTKDRVKAITQLGLRYNLLTNHTSFVAVDEKEIPNPQDGVTTVRQVLPLPQGVSKYAVGFEMSVHKVTEAIGRKRPAHQLIPVVVTPMNRTMKKKIEAEMSDLIEDSSEEVKGALAALEIKISLDANGVATVIIDMEVSPALRAFAQALTNALHVITRDVSFTIKCVEI